MIQVTVIDARDGSRLPGVAFTQLSPNGSPTGQGNVTNANGEIYVPAGWRYLVELLGYEDEDIITAEVPPGTGLVVQLSEAPETLDEFTFTGSRRSRSHWPLWVLAGAVTLGRS